MATNDQFMRFLAAWALMHETADEGWKAAVERGASADAEAMASGPEAFVDGLSAMIAEEKERLKVELASGATAPAGSQAEVIGHLEELRFEVAELRGRLESLTASLDAISGNNPDASEPSR